MDLYQPRKFAFSNEFEGAGIRFKPYLITIEKKPAIDILPVLSLAADFIQNSKFTGMPHCGLGYIIYHVGKDANWLLTRVWLPGGIVSGLLARIENGAYIEVHEPLIECVWEEVVVHHERCAWVKRMMSGENASKRYLSDKLPNGFY